MTKLLIIPSNTEQFNLNCDGLVIGIKGLSVNMPSYFDLTDLNIDKEVFVCLNKNMHNSDLELLESTLIELNNYSIKGVIYYDIAVVNMSKRLNLNYDLVWGQEHLTTNYQTINYWYKQGVKYTWLSNDITLREILEIKNSTKSKLMIPLFGYIPIFNSRRHLVKNYLDCFKLTDNSKINYMEKENKVFPVIDDINGTTVYNNSVLIALKEYLELKKNSIDYIILNSFMIDDFDEVLNIYRKVNIDNISNYEDRLTSLFSNNNKGFLYEETVYKVKKNDK